MKRTFAGWQGLVALGLLVLPAAARADVSDVQS